jgi:hypothetical protein
MTTSDISVALNYAKEQLNTWQNIRGTTKLSYDTINANIATWTANVTKLQTALDASINALISSL